MATFIAPLSACGTDAPDADAGAMDAGDRDAGTGALDAGLDATSGIDADGDGIPAERDCDDTQASIGDRWTRGCSHPCDPAAAEVCTDGVWSECMASADCTCVTDGETRVVACERCGMQAQECIAGGWTSTSGCLDQGECEPASVEMEEVPPCGLRQRLCRDSCSWTDWTWIREMGQCEPGTRFCIDEIPGTIRACTAACMWMYFDTEEDCLNYVP